MFFKDKNVYLVEGSRTDYNLQWPFEPENSYIEFKNSNLIYASKSKNEIYSQVRELLKQMSLDKENLKNSTWNPFGNFVKKGDKVALKPNFVRHFNDLPDQSLDVIITHMSVIRPLIDYAFLAVGKKGLVRIVEAPQADCEMDIIKKKFRIDELIALYKEKGYTLQFIDTRKEKMKIKEGVVLGLKPMAGDPNGYTIAKVNEYSEFIGNGIDSNLLRGADYDYDETSLHHHDNRHEYLISNSVLDNDLIINVPKIKTHYKIGLTVALKNLVGINGDKNWLPHWRKGTVDDGGDQFKDINFFNKAKSKFLEKIAPLLRIKPIAYTAMSLAKIIHSFGFKNNFGCGTWFGNDTIWRTALDLNKTLFYIDDNGKINEKLFDKRKYLTICDGIIAGEGQGPLAPKAKPLCILIGATNPAYCDLVIAKLMGFNYKKIRFLEKLFHIKKLPLIGIKDVNELKLKVTDISRQTEEYAYNDIPINYHFEAAPNWKGYIELNSGDEK
jgi:uncharacterized protein (DUF362 family)